MNNADKKIKLLDIAVRLGVKLDPWNNIKWVGSEGHTYRLKITKNLIRLESYNAITKKWLKIKKFNLKKTLIPWWEDVCVDVAKFQGRI